MARSVKIDPLTRIEGHLAFRIEVENQRVVEAFCSGEMFRGFEAILQGRDPLDAQQITQRICGICPISHGIASIQAQEAIYQVKPPENGRLMRNLILAANFMMSHITHFYHLSALDFLDVTAILIYTGQDQQLNMLKGWVQTQLASDSMYPLAPFLPRYEGHYLDDITTNLVMLQHYTEALRIRALCHKMAAIFGGKVPHAPALVPGGVTQAVTIDAITSYRSHLQEVLTFIDQAYLPDTLAIAQAFPTYWELGGGCKNFLAYGVFPESDTPEDTFLPGGVLFGTTLADFQEQQIAEQVTYAHFSSSSGQHPTQSRTVPDLQKAGAYSWIKAPRYQKQVMEVGPLARLLVAYYKKSHPALNLLLDNILSTAGKSLTDLCSVSGRHAARALETKLLAERCVEWIGQLKPDQSTFQDFRIPQSGQGVGLTEAPRGALGHWISLKEGKIAHYQCVVPTTWNCSPRDDQGQPGAVEQALIGTPVLDEQHPLEAARVVRSFDPCIACAVH